MKERCIYRCPIRDPCLPLIILVICCSALTLICPSILNPQPISDEAELSPQRLVVEQIIADSLAAKAGLKLDDRLLSYDGKPLPSPEALLAVRDNTIGKKEVTVRVRRGAETLTLSVPMEALGIQVRPELPSTALNLYQEGRTALQAQQIDEAIAKWIAAAKAARETGDKAAAAWVYGRVGKIYVGQRLEKAQETYLVAWELLEDGQDRAAQSRILSALGRCSQSLNDLAAAQRWYEQAWHVDDKAGNACWAVLDLIDLGNVAAASKDHEAAHERYSRALDILEHLKPNSLPVAGILRNLGLTAADRGKPSVAYDYFNRALAILERIAPDSLDFAIILNSMGFCDHVNGNLESARDYHTRALVIFEKLAPDSLSTANALNNLGAIVSRLGDLQAAQEYYARALAIFERQRPDSMEVAGCLNNLGDIAAERGDFELAQAYLSRALGGGNK